jgi:hypothetical protein
MDVSTPSSVSKLIDLLPLIIISVIVLVGFFTWEIFTKHIETFILLITSLLFAIWLYSGDIYSYVGWKEAHGTGNDPFFPKQAGETKLELSKLIIASIIGVVVLVLGFGLTLGLTSYKIGESVSTKTDVLKITGYVLLGVSGIILISLLWKAFKGDAASSENPSSTSPFSTMGKLFGGLISAVIGIYFVVRSTNIEKSETENVNDSLSVANAVLNTGLVLQVIALLASLYMMYRYNFFHPEEDTNPFIAYLGRFVPFVLLFVAGLIFIAVHKEWIGTNEGIGSGDDKNNMFVAHGIVYMTLAGIALLIALGKISTFNIFKMSGLITTFGIIGVIIWNFVSLNANSNFDLTEDDENNGNAYYQQVKDEVTKELQKSGNPEDATPEKIKAEMKIRMDQLNSKNKTAIKSVNNTMLIFALFITIGIWILYTAKMKIVECMKLPVKIKDIFVGECSDGNQYVKNAKLDSKLNNNPANIEKMNSEDWANILETNDDGEEDPEVEFSRFAVKLAKWSRWIPFLTIILVIMCISIVFTKVTTSEATMEWIAKSFRGDMFPKVKELLDTFFIVFIVGLFLCAILVLPMVREQSVGGLDVMTKFVDSIQVWQYKDREETNWKNYISAFVGCIVVLIVGLSPIWYDISNEYDTNERAKQYWAYLVFICILALCCFATFFHIPGGVPHEEFEKDNAIVRVLRLLFTSVYLVPLFLVSIFKLVIYLFPLFIGKLFNKPEWGENFRNEMSKWNFTKWKAAGAGAGGEEGEDRGTDLRLFGLGNILLPKDVVPKKTQDANVGNPAGAELDGANAALFAVEGRRPSDDRQQSAPSKSKSESVDQTKVNAVGKLIKVIFIVITFVIMILVLIYTVYKFSSDNKTPADETTSFTDDFSTPKAYAIYTFIAIIGIAGLVAYLREKFKTANSKTPEDYIFNDLKPEDSNSPMRQLTFGMTHIIYIVLMVIVWIYDKEKDEKDKDKDDKDAKYHMSVTGMTVLGILILFFHYILEFIDNKLPSTPGDSEDKKPQLAPITNLLFNIRFIVNTVFLIVLCILAYYKQHGAMIAVIVIMFIFHLTKSILGVKLLKFLWACIIYIPCLFLDLIQGFQGTVGDTSRTIWIIVAIEILLIAILYGGPYLLNYIGASSSQMVKTPISINKKYDTNLTTQSKEIFIYHNTGIGRTKEDNDANCPAEEKKRYNYAISGWFFLNNNITSKSSDLEIFNFGDVPKMTYNASKNELKLYCNTLSTSNIMSKTEEIYNSRTNYNAVVMAEGSSQEKKRKVQMALEGEELDSDIPLQRWNYFVINYDGKNMDFFLNNKLIFESKFIMPDIRYKSITIGDTSDGTGLNGRICNFSFHKFPLTKEQIRWTYNMLKSQNPPMIGGYTTVDDEVKSTGTTTIYSR